ncbi:hypothetical protein [Pseudomonas sp. 22 E 5]|nr:hypothetical protein [Pseudomonas sp. 22 E 5]
MHGFGGRCVHGTFLGARIAVDHVVAGDFLLAGTHQGQFDLVLDFFDVDGAARRHATLEGRGDLFGQAGNGVVDARRSGSGAAFNCEKRFGDGDGDFVIGVRNDSAVTLDHTQLARCGSGQIHIRISGLRHGALRVLASCVGLHGGLSPRSIFDCECQALPATPVPFSISGMGNSCHPRERFGLLKIGWFHAALAIKRLNFLPLVWLGAFFKNPTCRVFSSAEVQDNAFSRG